MAGGTLWAKVDGDLDSNPKIRKGGNLARQVFEFVMRKNALRGHGGSIPVSYVEAEYMADQLMLEPVQAEQGLADAIRVGLLAIETGEVVLVGWSSEHGRGPLTEAERKRSQRARDKASGQKNGRPDTETMSGQNRDTDTECIADDEMSRMSGRDRDVRTVTDQREEIRKEEREPARARDPGAPDAAPPLARGTGDLNTKAVNAALDEQLIARRKLGDRIWDRLNTLRAELAGEFGCAGILPLGPMLDGRRELADRIVESGADAERCCEHVLAVIAAEARAKRSLERVGAFVFSKGPWQFAIGKPDPREAEPDPLTFVRRMETW